MLTLPPPASAWIAWEPGFVRYKGSFRIRGDVADSTSASRGPLFCALTAMYS
jgi:hypothetical protein